MILDVQIRISTTNVGIRSSNEPVGFPCVVQENGVRSAECYVVPNDGDVVPVPRSEETMAGGTYSSASSLMRRARRGSSDRDLRDPERRPDHRGRTDARPGAAASPPRDRNSRRGHGTRRRYRDRSRQRPVREPLQRHGPALRCGGPRYAVNRFAALHRGYRPSRRYQPLQTVRSKQY